MDGFTTIDLIVAAIIVISAILAYARGFVRESLAILGWIAAAVLAFIFAESIRPMIQNLPVLSKFLGDSCELALIAAFAVVLAGALVVFSIITPLFSSVVQRSALGGVDQAMGFLFGVARGILIVAIAFLVYDRVQGERQIDMVDNSRSAAIFDSISAQLNQSMPQDVPTWLQARFDQFTAACTAESAVSTGTETPAAPAAPTAPAN